MLDRWLFSPFPSGQLGALSENSFCGLSQSGPARAAIKPGIFLLAWQFFSSFERKRFTAFVDEATGNRRRNIYKSGEVAAVVAVRKTFHKRTTTKPCTLQEESPPLSASSKQGYGENKRNKNPPFRKSPYRGLPTVTATLLDYRSGLSYQREKEENKARQIRAKHEIRGNCKNSPHVRRHRTNVLPRCKRQFREVKAASLAANLTQLKQPKSIPSVFFSMVSVL